MLIKTKKIKNIVGEITAPSSKSHTQRAIALAIINNGKTVLKGLGFANDEKVAINIAKQLKTEVEIKNDEVIISSNPKNIFSRKINDKEVFSIGESGLSARMFTPILALKSNPITISGEGSILKRPMQFFEDYFPDLGVKIKSQNGCLPLEIKGPLNAKNINVDGSFSSQYITGLIYAFVASKLENNVKMSIENPKSIPYINLSLEVLSQFGVNLEFRNNQIIFEKNIEIAGDRCIELEGDWSGMAFYAVMAAVRGELTLKNLSCESKQADVAILKVLKSFGAKIIEEKDSIIVRSSEKNAFNFDATDCPDLFPPLAVLAIFGNGTSRIKGIHRLTHKESDRAKGIKSIFYKLGINVDLDIENDEMIIKGGQKINSATVDSLNDHRIAMAVAIIGALTDKELTIERAEAINKSFPSFYEVLGFEPIE